MTLHVLQGGKMKGKIQTHYLKKLLANDTGTHNVNQCVQHYNIFL